MIYYVWLPHLSILFSRFTDVIAYISTSFLFMTWHCMNLPQSVYPVIADGRLGCYRLLAVVNRATMGHSPS